MHNLFLPEQRARLAPFVACLTFLSFSIMDFIIKVLSSSIPVITIIFFSSVFTVFFSLAIGLIFNKSWIKAKSLRFHLLRGVISIVVGYSVFNSFKLLGLSVAYSIVFLSPLLNVFFSYFFIKEAPTRQQLVGVFCGFVGIMIALRPSQSTLELGHILAFVAALGISLNALVTRKFGRNENLLTFGLYSGIFVTLFYSIPVIQQTDFVAIPLHVYLVFALIGGQFLLNTSMLTFAIQNTNLTVIGSLQYTQLVWGFVLEAIFLSVRPSLFLIIGAFTIILGGLLVTDRGLVKKAISKLNKRSTA